MDLGAFKHYLLQCKYTLDLFEETEKLGAKPVEIPIEYNYGFHSHNGELFHHPKSHQTLVRKLLYFTITRPDIC